jgi:hypothetical protein
VNHTRRKYSGCFFVERQNVNYGFGYAIFRARKSSKLGARNANRSRDWPALVRIARTHRLQNRTTTISSFAENELVAAVEQLKL